MWYSCSPVCNLLFAKVASDSCSLLSELINYMRRLVFFSTLPSSIWLKCFKWNVWSRFFQTFPYGLHTLEIRVGIKFDFKSRRDFTLVIFRCTCWGTERRFCSKWSRFLGRGVQWLRILKGPNISVGGPRFTYTHALRRHQNLETLACKSRPCSRLSIGRPALI